MPTQEITSIRGSFDQLLTSAIAPENSHNNFFLHRMAHALLSPEAINFDYYDQREKHMTSNRFVILSDPATRTLVMISFSQNLEADAQSDFEARISWVHEPNITKKGAIGEIIYTCKDGKAGYSAYLPFNEDSPHQQVRTALFDPGNTHWQLSSLVNAAINSEIKKGWVYRDYNPNYMGQFYYFPLALQHAKVQPETTKYVLPLMKLKLLYKLHDSTVQTAT